MGSRATVQAFAAACSQAVRKRRASGAQLKPANSFGWKVGTSALLGKQSERVPVHLARSILSRPAFQAMLLGTAPPAPPAAPSRCDPPGCRGQIDAFGDHTLSCTRTGLIARRAKIAERAWVRVAREAVGPDGQVVPATVASAHSSTQRPLPIRSDAFRRFASLDLKKAFDRMEHNALLDALVKQSVESSYIQPLKASYMGQRGSAAAADFASCVESNKVMFEPVAFQRWTCGSDASLEMPHRTLRYSRG